MDDEEVSRGYRNRHEEDGLRGNCGKSVSDGQRVDLHTSQCGNRNEKLERYGNGSFQQGKLPDQLRQIYHQGISFR